MGNSLQINWSRMNEHGRNTLKNSEDFENARVAFINIIESLDECWKGKDANNYKATCINFLNSLKKDTLYFEQLGNYFDIGSKTYSSVVKEQTDKLDNLNRMLEEDRLVVFNNEK